jgi:hypothetical protein
VIRNNRFPAMNETPRGSQEAPAAPAAPGLQFEQVEFTAAPPPRSCSACKAVITDEYFERAGQLFCRPCADQAAGKHAGKAAFWRAAGWGLGAAVLGTIVWALVRLTGYELGIVAIAVGVLVGKAVNKGARGASGWKYRALAIGLTYASITSSYVPDVVKAVAGQAEKNKASAKVGDAKLDDSAAGEKDPVAQQAAGGDPAGPAVKPMSPLLAIPLFAVLVFGIAFAAPFLAGLDNIMGLVIIAIALYEAWKLTRPVPVTGPFKIAAPPAPVAPAAAP